MELPASPIPRALALLQIVDQPFSATEFAAIVARGVLGLSVAYLVYRFVRCLPWPRPFCFRFVLIHLAAAPASGVMWLVLTSAAVSLITGRPFIATARDVPGDFLGIGITVYLVIAAVTYLDDATARRGRGEQGRHDVANRAGHDGDLRADGSEPGIRSIPARDLARAGVAIDERTERSRRRLAAAIHRSPSGSSEPPNGRGGAEKERGSRVTPPAARAADRRLPS